MTATMEALTFSKTSGKRNWKRQTFLILGSPKIGKSELFAQDSTIFLDIEGGLNLLDVVKFPKERPFLDWDELEQTVDGLVAMRIKGTFPSQVDTIVIDTATRLVNLSTAKVLELLNNKHPNKNWEALEEVTVGGDKGNPGWAMRTNLVDNLLSKVKQLGIALVIIGHIDNKKSKNEMGVEVEKQTISIGGNLGKAFCNNSDHILHFMSKVGPDGIISRTVRTLGTATLEAGSRGLMVPDRWELVNPKSRKQEDLAEAAKANYDKLKGFFEAGV